MRGDGGAVEWVPVGSGCGLGLVGERLREQKVVYGWRAGCPGVAKNTFLFAAKSEREKIEWILKIDQSYFSSGSGTPAEDDDSA